MLRSLRSRLLLASFLWTAGLLLVIHMLSLLLMHTFPGAMSFHGRGAILTGFALMIAGVIAVRIGMRPFHHLRVRLAAMRTAASQRIAGDYPSEVQPLVDDLNALLEERQKAVERAMAAAGDLAHGLKTPLALLAQEAERAGASGNRELAETLAQQVERMSRHVNYHLARARAAASGPVASAPCSVEPCLEALARTLRKLHAGRGLDISVAVEPGLTARIRGEDLEEMLGNLLDNACKWARSRVRVEGRIGERLLLTVDDDGPGLSADQRVVVLKRGVRLDEAAPGSGLGLAIVRDLAELYRGSVELRDSPLGGLRVRISLPVA